MPRTRSLSSRGALPAAAMVALCAGLLGGLVAAPGAAAVDQPPSACVPPVVTGDIQAAIEQHIRQQAALGGGYFRVPFQEGQLALQLVRVHVEYLASLGPQRHFACVDMAGADGQFYDIDFFLDGDRGSMVVTETTVHKLNGRPFYLWEQNEDGHWVRASVEDAAAKLLGVVSGSDAFEFRYQATLPPIAGPARCWIPLATSDEFQQVTLTAVSAPGTRQVLVDSANGNQVLFLELTPEHGGQPLELVYDVRRREKSAYPGDRSEAARWLDPERLVPADDRLTAIAAQVVEGQEGDLARARALYDHVIDAMSYIKAGDGWGRGSALYACDVRTGNCTDYHAYFIGLARAAGIPARFAIGAAIPSERDEGGTDGYHCWAEFFAEGKWWPVDISEADKFSALSMYYFGHQPANRLELARGRDLVLDPGPASGPVNFLAYPLLEVEGQPQRVQTLFLFRRTHR